MSITHIKTLDGLSRRRSGIIPYLMVNKDLYFLLAQDKKTGDFSDFGGHQMFGETILDTAIREFREESNDIFPSIDSKIKDTSTLIYDDHMVLIFLPVPYVWSLESDLFSLTPNTEVSHIRWVKKEVLDQMLNRTSTLRLWDKIREFIQQTNWNNFSLLLENEWKHHHT